MIGWLIFAGYVICAATFGSLFAYVRYRWFVKREYLRSSQRIDENMFIGFGAVFWPAALLISMVPLPINFALKTKHQSVRDQEKRAKIEDREREIKRQQREIDAFCEANNLPKLNALLLPGDSK